MMRTLLAAGISLFAASGLWAQAGFKTRSIVVFNDDVSWNSFQASSVPSDDARFRPGSRLAYLDRSVVGAVVQLERAGAFRAFALYSQAIKGFAAELTPQQIEALRRSPLVKRIEPDPVIRLQSQTLPWGIDRIDADLSSTKAGDGAGTVTGVNLYIIDTGIDATHPDLNVVDHVTFAGEPNTDCNGHGTHVAGVAAARDNNTHVVGVAPGAPLYGVKVLSCAGLTFPSVIIQGIDWVTANAQKPAVANMSLGSLIPLRAVNEAVRASAATGIVYVIAAGNGNPFTGEAVDACTSSPAGAGYDLLGFPNGIITVAATDQNEAEASFSNFGACVDVWAPGVAIPSTWLMNAGELATASGTSMAAPHVAGAAALFLSRYPNTPPWFVELVLKSTADVPGALSKDGRQIRRIAVRSF